MCEKCDDIDARILHYTALAADTLDHLTRLTIEFLIEDLAMDKAEMHPPLQRD
jgi:hypothetical protein